MISTSGEPVTAFVDTNVLVYAYDRDEPAKRDVAIELLEELGESDDIVLSTQVLQEFFVTVTRKLARPLAPAEALEALRAWAELPTVQVDSALVLAAAETSRIASVSFWDALILEAAICHGCERLLSEDLQHGFELRGVRVHNPFRT